MRRASPSFRAERLAAAAAIFLVVFTPLAFGTVQPWSEVLVELVILAMAATWILGMVYHWELRIEWPPGSVPAALFLAVVLLQITPLPSGLGRWVAPLSASLAREVSDYTGQSPGAVTISVFPYATLREALKLGAVAAFFLVVYNTHRTRARVRRAIWAMVASATLVALFGVLQRVTWNGRLFWLGPEAPHAAAFGPFVNRAHFAGLVVIVVPVALALVVARESGRRPLDQSWRARLRRWNAPAAGPSRLVPWLVALMAGAALVSGSRGGVVALVGALVMTVVLVARGRAGRRRPAEVAFVLLLIGLAAVWLGGDALFGTIGGLASEVSRPRESGRLRLWAEALGLLRASPAFGTGYASFASAFPLVRTTAAPVVYTHAESDWVQLLTDTGVVGFALALATVGTVGRALVRCYRVAAGPPSRALAAGGLVALVGSGVQGLANFNLPIMSNLIFLALVLAVALRPLDEATGSPGVGVPEAGAGP